MICPHTGVDCLNRTLNCTKEWCALRSLAPAPSPAEETPGVDGLPGSLALAKAIAEQKWPHTTDATVWASEFVKRFPGSGLSEDDMPGWFANAIMAGYDTANARVGTAEAVPAAVPAEEDTPRTDNLVSIHDEASEGGTAGYNNLLAHARTLERELAQMAAENARICAAHKGLMLEAERRVSELEAALAEKSSADAARWRYWRNYWPALCRSDVSRFASIDLKRIHVDSPELMDKVTDAAIRRGTP